MEGSMSIKLNMVCNLILLIIMDLTVQCLGCLQTFKNMKGMMVHSLPTLFVAKQYHDNT